MAIWHAVPRQHKQEQFFISNQFVRRLKNAEGSRHILKPVMSDVIGYIFTSFFFFIDRLNKLSKHYNIAAALQVSLALFITTSFKRSKLDIYSPRDDDIERPRIERVLRSTRPLPRDY